MILIDHYWHNKPYTNSGKRVNISVFFFFSDFIQTLFNTLFHTRSSMNPQKKRVQHFDSCSPINTHLHTLLVNFKKKKKTLLETFFFFFHKNVCVIPSKAVFKQLYWLEDTENTSVAFTWLLKCLSSISSHLLPECSRGITVWPGPNMGGWEPLVVWDGIDGSLV